MRLIAIGTGIAAMVVVSAGTALAEPPSEIGVSVGIGGGVGGFVDEDMVDISSTQGTWEGRVVVGTNLPFAFEASYVGGAQNLDTTGLDPDSYLLTTILEGDLRFNVMPGPVQPFIFAGLGWGRYQLEQASFNTSPISSEDDIVTIPLGVGVAFNIGDSWTIDVRGTYRVASEEDMVVDNTGTVQELDSWNVAAAAAFIF